MTPLTSSQVDLLKKSFRILNANQVASVFYVNLFASYPHFKPLFSTDMKEQVAKLVSVFELVIYSFEEVADNEFHLQKELLVPLQQLGRLHSEKEIHKDHYELVNQLLIDAMKTEGGDIFTEEIESAWLLALCHLTEAMTGKPEDVKPTNLSLKDTFLKMKDTILNRYR